MTLLQLLCKCSTGIGLLSKNMLGQVCYVDAALHFVLIWCNIHLLSW